MRPLVSLSAVCALALAGGCAREVTAADVVGTYAAVETTTGALDGTRDGEVVAVAGYAIEGQPPLWLNLQLCDAGLPVAEVERTATQWLGRVESAPCGVSGTDEVVTLSGDVLYGDESGHLDAALSGATSDGRTFTHSFHGERL